jgi:hypothetical protein
VPAVGLPGYGLHRHQGLPAAKLALSRAQAATPLILIASMLAGGLASASWLSCCPIRCCAWGHLPAIAMLGVAEPGAELSSNLDVIGGGMNRA